MINFLLEISQILAGNANHEGKPGSYKIMDLLEINRLISN
jgi:hypothetical protein